MRAPEVGLPLLGGPRALSAKRRRIGRDDSSQALANEQDFPHLVELSVPPKGFRNAFLEFDAFHSEHRIPVRRGQNRHEVKQVYIRFCFPNTATADAFRNGFGGQRCVA
jgi:hypothetical protein